MKSIKWIFLGLLCLIVIFLFVLPTIVSSPTVLDKALPIVNNKIPGTLEVDRFSVGWQKGLRVEHLVYTDLKQVRFTAESITGNRGLLALALASDNLGQITVKRPWLTVIMPDEKGKQGAKQQKERGSRGDSATQPQGEEGKTKTEPAAKAGKKPFWDKFSLALHLEEGQLLVQEKGKDPLVVLQNLALQSSLADGSVTLSAKGVGDQNNGQLSVDGEFNLPPTTETSLETMVAKISATVANFELRNLLAMLQNMESVPQGKGVLNADVLLNSNGFKKVSVQSHVKLDSLALTGGFLGSDHPEFDNIDLRVDASSENGKEWAVRRCNLESQPLTFQTEGILALGRSNFTITGSLLMAELFGRFPNLLKVRDDVRVTDGITDFHVELSDEKGKGRLVSKVTLHDLRGTLDGKNIAWSEPVMLDLDVSGGLSDFQVQKLRLDAPFLKANGKGNMKEFSLQASGNVQEIFSRVGTIVDLPWSGSGRLQLNLDSDSQDGKVYRFNTDINIADFSLRKDNKALFPAHAFFLQARGTAPLMALQDKNTAMDLGLRCNSWPGTVQLDAVQVRLGEKKEVALFNVNSQLQLKRLASLLGTLELMDPQMTFAGDMELSTQGSLKEQNILLKELNGKINDFLFDNKKMHVEEKQIAITSATKAASGEQAAGNGKQKSCDALGKYFDSSDGFSGVNLQNRTFAVQGARLSSSVGVLHLDSIGVPDWKKPVIGSCAVLDFDGSLERIATLLQGTGHLDQEMAWAGSAKVTASLLPEQNREHTVQGDFNLGRFSLTKDKGAYFSDENVKGAVTAAGVLDGGDVTIKDLELASSPLSLKASGKLVREGGVPSFSLQGKMTPDLEWLAGLVHAAKPDLGLVMTGRNDETFDLYFPLGNATTNEKMQKAKLVTGLSADHIALFGTDVKDLGVPLHLDAGLLALSVDGELNQGKLSVAPKADFNSEPPILKIDDNSMILQDVHLEKPLVDGLLGRIHPLFGLLATPQGSVSMRMESFTWPLDKNGSMNALFTSTIDLQKVNLVGSGFLREILTPLGLAGEEMKLRDSETLCKGENGRMSCSPIQILIAGSNMTVSGSVGFDKTLDYLLEIPVTEKLVGREGYRVLEGTAIKVPIKGTLSKPGFNRGAITSAVADLTKQAAGRAIQKEVEKALPGLLENIFGN